jgi:hypothetical protein
VQEWPDDLKEGTSTENTDGAAVASDGAAVEVKRRKCTVFVNAAVSPFWKNQHNLVSTRLNMY